MAEYQPFMNHRDALNKTFQAFKVNAAEISRLSGVRESQISRFRHGKTDLYAETLIGIVNALSSDAKAYYYLLLMGNGSKSVAEPSGQYKAG